MGAKSPLARVFVHDADDGESEAAVMPSDDFNDPYARKAAILRGLGLDSGRGGSGPPNCELTTVAVPRTRLEASLVVHGSAIQVDLEYMPHGDLDLALAVHGAKYVRYIATAWDRWAALAPEKRCRFFRMETETKFKRNTKHWSANVPALVPSNFVSRTCPNAQPGTDVHAQTCWYHTDDDTPVFKGLLPSLAGDMEMLKNIIYQMETDLKGDLRNVENVYYYALTSHPGHHAGHTHAGGYCYLNNAGILAKALCASGLNLTRIAILDVDYHAGNGTSSLFYSDPDILVTSIHADPNHDYPWNSGYADEIGLGRGQGKTVNVPLRSGANWGDDYQPALKKTLHTIDQHDAQVLIVSLGIDTHTDDPVQEKATAGMDLTLADYEQMGAMIASAKLPTVFVQEGGYNLESAGSIIQSIFRGMEDGFHLRFQERGESPEVIQANVLQGLERGFPARFEDKGPVRMPVRNKNDVSSSSSESESEDDDVKSLGPKSPVQKSPGVKSPKSEKEASLKSPKAVKEKTPTPKKEPEKKKKGVWFGF